MTHEKRRGLAYDFHGVMGHKPCSCLPKMDRSDLPTFSGVRTTSSQKIGGTMKLKELVGSGEKIGLLVLPFLIVGLILNILFPSLFSVGGPPTVLKVISTIILIAGVIIWLWSVA